MNKKIIILPFILVFLIYFLGIFSSFNLRITDSLYGKESPIDNIIIVEIDDKSLEDIGRWPWNRNNFTKIVNILENSSVIGLDIAFYSASSEDLNFLNEIQKNNITVLAMEYKDFELKENLVYPNEKLLPTKIFENYSHIGYVNVINDRDSIVRGVNLNIQGKYNSFSEEIYRIYTGNEFEFKENRFLINFNDVSSFKKYSFSDVLNEKVNSKEFENSIILIGASSLSLKDTLNTPTSKDKEMPGVEVHANIIETMILENNLQNSGMFLDLVTIFLFIFITYLLLEFFNVFVSLSVLFILMIFYIFISIFVFSNYNIILNIIYPIISLVISFPIFLIDKYLTEINRKKEIKNAFSKYVSPKLIDELIKNPSLLKLGGENREITVFFSDIEGFTSISENLSPENLVKLLNEYLTEISEIILKNGGLIDKFIGDAVMAFWGAPTVEKNQVYLACKSVLEIQEKLKELLPIWEKKYGVKVKTRIGLNYGNAVIGNMGSENRFDYTAMGDTVNLASRLEAINKTYNTYKMVSEFVYEKAKRSFEFREIDLVKVKGKNKPVKIYELISLKGENKKSNKEFEKGLDLYKKGKFESAKDIFEKIKEKDNTAKVFLKRCEYLISEPPKEWNGVWEMKTK